MRKKTIVLMCCILGFTAFGLFTANYSRLSELRAQESENKAKILELNNKIALLKEQQERTDVDPPKELGAGEQDEALSSAAELGAKVADYQNAYASLNSGSDREAFEANVEAMDACLSYNDKAARVPWYTGSIPGTWRFVTDGAFKGTSLNVLWVCEDPDTKDLMAYATAVYNSEENLFGNVSYKMSLLGAGSVPSSGDAPAGVDTDEVNAMLQNMQGLTIPEERQLTDEELQDLRSEQWQDRENAMKGGE